MIAVDKNLSEKIKDIAVTTLTESHEIVESHLSPRPEGFRLSKYSYNTIVKYSGIDALGCGEDTLNEDLARTKSLSEAIERVVMKWVARNSRKQITSNGWAAHPNLEEALYNSVLELTERDSALMHWLTMTPMLRVHANEVFPPEFLSELKRSEFPKLVTIVSFDFSGPLVTSLLMNENGHAISGHASGADFSRAVVSATIEACRAAHHYQRYSYYSETKNIFGQDYIGVIDPGAHSLMYAYHEKLPTWIFGKSISTNEAGLAWKDKITEVAGLIEDTKFSVYKLASHYVVRAENPGLQQIYWGSTQRAAKADLINWDRVKKKSNLINNQPHMVG